MASRAADFEPVSTTSDSRSPAPRSFATQFRIAMAARNTNYSEVARAIRVAPNTVGNWAADDAKRQTSPKASDVLSLCRHLNVSADFLLGLADKLDGPALCGGLLLVDEAHIERAKASPKVEIEAVKVPLRYRLVDKAGWKALHDEIEAARKQRRGG